MLSTLNRELRRAVRSMARGGLSASAIAAELELPKSMVRETLFEGNTTTDRNSLVVRYPFLWS